MVTTLDPNILSPFQMLEPGMSLLASLIVSAASVSLSLVVSWYFFRSYRFSGFGYLLGLPVGFVLLALSFASQHLSLNYQNDLVLHPAFFWVQIVSQSEGFALIAISYQFKNFEPARNGHYISRLPTQSAYHRGHSESRNVMMSILPTVMIALPFALPTSIFVLDPYFNYSRIADMGFCMILFDMAVIAYIFKSTIVSLIKAGNVKLLYIPAAYALFFLEQYSLTITYFDNSVIAFIGSLVARILALALFVYVAHHVIHASRRLEIEAREKA